MAVDTDIATKKRIFLASPHMSDEGYEMGIHTGSV